MRRQSSPAGTSNKNYSVLKHGVVLDYSGRIIGQVVADGSVVSADNRRIGKILSSGQAVNDRGILLGEIVEGDIVINEQDKVVGFVNAEGKVLDEEQAVIGKMISSNLVVDNNGKIMGHPYKIGANILGNGGKYFGLPCPERQCVEYNKRKDWIFESNGSYINIRNQVSGYVLDEVAQNRRN